MDISDKYSIAINHRINLDTVLEMFHFILSKQLVLAHGPKTASAAQSGIEELEKRKPLRLD